MIVSPAMRRLTRLLSFLKHLVSMSMCGSEASKTSILPRAVRDVSAISSMAI